MKKQPTKEEWLAARAAYEAGEEFSFLAGRLNVSRQCVRQRALRESWARVAPGPDDKPWQEAAAAVLQEPVSALALVEPGELLTGVREAVLRRQQGEISRVRTLFNRALDDLEGGLVVAGRDVETAAKILTALHRAEIAAFGLEPEEARQEQMVVRIVREEVPHPDGY